MKNKIFPLLIGGTVGFVGGLICKDKVLKTPDKKSCNEVTVDCQYLSSYGNLVSLLIRNVRYDIFLEEEIPDWDTYELFATLQYSDSGTLLNILSINGIKVNGYSQNTKQIEHTCFTICKDVTSTGLAVGYNGKFYDILLDEGFVVKEPYVEVVVADGDDVFDILSVNGFPVLDWEERPEEKVDIRCFREDEDE